MSNTARTYWANPRTKTWHTTPECPIVKAGTKVYANGRRQGFRIKATWKHEDGRRIHWSTLHDYDGSGDMLMIRKTYGYETTCKHCRKLNPTDSTYFEAERYQLRAGGSPDAIGVYPTRELAVEAAKNMFPHVSFDWFALYDSLACGVGSLDFINRDGS